MKAQITFWERSIDAPNGTFPVYMEHSDVELPAPLSELYDGFELLGFKFYYSEEVWNNGWWARKDNYQCFVHIETDPECIAYNTKQYEERN